MSRASLARELESRYPRGMSRADIARDFHITRAAIPVESFTKIHIEGLRRPKYAAESIAAWVYSNYELGKLR